MAAVEVKATYRTVTRTVTEEIPVYTLTVPRDLLVQLAAWSFMYEDGNGRDLTDPEGRSGSSLWGAAPNDVRDEAQPLLKRLREAKYGGRSQGRYS